MANLQLWRGGRPRGLLDSWDDFGKEFDRMFSEMENFLAPVRAGLADDEGLMRVACEIEEGENNYLVSFDIPGVAKEDVDIEILGNQLVVSGERKSQQERREGAVYRSERRYGQFRRAFTLPEGTNTEMIEAHYENGVLHLSIPKSEHVKSKKINIEEGKGGFFKKLIGKENKTESKQDESKKVS